MCTSFALANLHTAYNSDVIEHRITMKIKKKRKKETFHTIAGSMFIILIINSKIFYSDFTFFFFLPFFVHSRVLAVRLCWLQSYRENWNYREPKSMYIISWWILNWRKGWVTNLIQTNILLAFDQKLCLSYVCVCQRIN